MDWKVKIEIIKRYNERLKIYGDDPRTLGWFKGRQKIRFKVLTEIADLTGKSILDVGCGFGDLYGYLKEKGIRISDYLGIDINPELIKIAKRKYPDAKFKVMDIEEEDLDTQYDYVISCGVFNYNIPNAEKWIKNMLKRYYEICREGVAADFMSRYVDYTTDELYYASPEEIFRYCKTLSKRVVLRHDYMPYEFCIYIYKDDRINERNVFAAFEEKLKSKEKLRGWY